MWDYISSAVSIEDQVDFFFSQDDLCRVVQLQSPSLQYQ